MTELKQEVWNKARLLIKVAVIGGIMGLLMIPTCQVQSLISEREARQREAVTEVSGKWAGRQVITAPVIVLPYRAASAATTDTVLRYATFLADTVEIRSDLQPQEKHRGIYKVMLYSASSEMKGTFTAPNLQALGIRPESVVWADAFVRIGIGDIRGLNEELTLRWNGKTLPFQIDPASSSDTATTLQAPLRLTGPQELQQVAFSGRLLLNGSQNLLFSPFGKSATVQIRSPWPHPSFVGDGLPVTTQVGKEGFSATWRLLGSRRGLSQQFRGDVFSGRQLNPASSGIGVDLFVPVNAYQKTMRSVKYALLCIVLTFAAFFIIETVNGRPVHPFQYGLIGLALVLFYALLLSFSEYIGFNPAYAVASVATIGLITWFVRGLLQSGRLTTLLSVVLVLLYGFVFTTLQLQDFSLLLGSVALFLTLGVIMYFSRRINR
jgi:inner membrane protein